MGHAKEDYKNLLEHWNRVFCLTEEERAQAEEPCGEEELKGIAPSEKLFDAAASLGACENVLDYGSGSAWAGIIAAKSGCPHVTCADPAPNAAEMAALNAKQFGVGEQVHPVCITDSWIGEVPDETYDGIFCSNVLDVIPPEMAEEILRNMARIIKAGGRVVIGMNDHIEPQRAAEKGLSFERGNLLYIDGVLRMVNRTDEEWTQLLGKHFVLERLDHFAWPGEKKERRRLFFLAGRR